MIEYLRQIIMERFIVGDFLFWKHKGKTSVSLLKAMASQQKAEGSREQNLLSKTHSWNCGHTSEKKWCWFLSSSPNLLKILLPIVATLGTLIHELGNTFKS